MRNILRDVNVAFDMFHASLRSAAQSLLGTEAIELLGPIDLDMSDEGRWEGDIEILNAVVRRSV